MEHEFQEYLCLTDLLDQDLTACEFFSALSPAVQDTLRRQNSDVASFSELQERAARLRADAPEG